MTENVQQLTSVSEMIRITAENSLGFMQQVAEHIEKLEAAVAQLRTRVEELEAENGNDNQTQ